jgi:hypothetical protein
MRRALVLLAFLAIPAHAEQDGITVQGQRDQRKLRQGQWEVSVTPAYHYGSNLDKTGNMRAMGKARSWRFCLPETQVEAMVRLRAHRGGGHHRLPEVAGDHGQGPPARHPALRGGNVTQVDENPMKTKTVPTRLDLTVVGRYEASSLKLEFQDLRDLLYRDPGAPGASRSSSSRRISPGTTCRKPMTGRSTGPM